MELFFRDNHSPDDVIYNDASQDSTQWLKKTLLNLYGDHFDFDHVQEIEGSNINSGNYKIGNYYIKTIRHNDDKKYVQKFPIISHTLRQFDIPTGLFLKNVNGDYISDYCCHLTQDKVYILVQDFIKGHFFSGKENEMLEMLGYLKRLSKLKLKDDSALFNTPYSNWNPDETINIAANEIRKKKKLDHFDKKISPILDQTLASIKKYSSLLDYLSLPGDAINHCDLHPHNLLFSEGSLSSIIDLESFVHTPHESAEAFAIFKLGRKSIYTGALTCNALKKLAQENAFNLRELYPFIDLELIRRLCSILDLHYQKNNYDWDSDLDKHITGRIEAKNIFL